MFLRFLLKVFKVFSTKTDVAKHESVTQKHMKSASHKTHTIVYTVCSFPFHGAFKGEIDSVTQFNSLIKIN